MTARSKLALLLVVFTAAMAAAWFALRIRQPGTPDAPSVRPSRIPDSSRETEIEGDAPGSTRAAATVPEPQPEASIQGIRLFGSVTGSDGRPFSHPETVLGLVSATGNRRSASIEHGEYAFDRAEPGVYRLQFRKPGFRHLDLEITIRDGEEAHRQDVRIENAWTIRVHILTPSGEDFRSEIAKAELGPFVRPTILVTTESPPERLERTLTLDRGNDGVGLAVASYQFERDDRVFVQADPPVFVSVLLRDQVLATQCVQDPVEDLTFVLEVSRFVALLGGITVRLVNGETGLPGIEGGVFLVTNDSMESWVRPDEQGVVGFQNRVPGLYEVHARLKGFALEVRTVEVPPGVTVDLGTITFGKGCPVRGRCVDREGKPRRVPANLVPLSESEASTFGWLVRIDDEGHFGIANLPCGRYALRVTSGSPGSTDAAEVGWSAVPLLVDTRSHPAEDLVLVVQRPSAVTLRPVGIADGLRFEVRTSEGVSCEKGLFEGSMPQHVELAPGLYSLRLLRGSETLREVPFTVGDDPLVVEVNP